MVNLYWKNNNQITDVEEKPFINEADFEKFIFDNQNILGGDISIIHRQIRSGTKDGIPDMIGIDTDNRICIIELKNIEANEDIVPQALQYAIWAETNPDSIKSLWLECKNKPEDLKPDWDNLDIRILLVAPNFKQNVLKMSKKINYPVELYKVRSPDDHFDRLSVAFGIRNFEHLEQGLAEMHRVLRPGGKMVILELSYPDNPFLLWCYKLYALHFLPFIGGWISGDREAYTYLPKSILKFPKADRIVPMLERIGYQQVGVRRFTFGVCTMYTGKK